MVTYRNYDFNYKITQMVRSPSVLLDPCILIFIFAYIPF